MDIRVNHRKTIHRGRVFDTTVENVTLPNGVTVDLDVLRHPGAAAIVPLTSDNEVVMIHQYRHAIGRMLWEIPAGTLDNNEEPQACARRELIEETGFRAATWHDLGAVTPVAGYSNERIRLFLALDLSPAEQDLDMDEVLEVHPLPFQRVVEMIAANEIEDAKTIVAIFRTLQRFGSRLDDGRIQVPA